MSDNRFSRNKESALQTLADISNIITSSHDAEATLLHTAKMIAERLDVGACTIYVYDKEEQKLTLRATQGLNQQAIGRVKLSPTEGLVGLVLEKAAAVQVDEMQTHPRFKHFPELEEDRYHSFLGVPLMEHRKPIGVIGLHTHQSRRFSQEEEHILITIASQISGLVSKALLMEKLGESSQKEQPPAQHSTRIIGVPVAPGVALGNAILIEQHILEAPEKQTEDSPQVEQQKFHVALEQTITETLALIEKVSEYLTANEAAIFHAHLMFLEDSGFQAKINHYIDEGASAAWSIFQVIEEYLKAFEAIDDPYLKERGADLQDMGYRLLQHMGYGRASWGDHEGIVVTKELLPGDVVQFDSKKIKGIVTSAGGAASHAAILARSRFIPAICVTEKAIEAIREGDVVAVDGKHGYMVSNPGEEIQVEFERLLAEQAQYLSHLDAFRDQTCQTTDGERIYVLANVGLVSETHAISHYGAEGIGLYRSEVFFLSLDHYPSVDEQVEVYSKIIESVQENQPVVFRTLDVGGDNAAPYMQPPAEGNPFMGNRAIRLQMQNPGILKNQVKAILIAASQRKSDAQGHKNVFLIFPMISHLEEIRFAKNLFRQCQEELQKEGKEAPSIPLGMMFEVPAAVVLCESFIPEISFLAIGSNDLTQYVMAVDRNNPHVAHLYDPLHPAVLRLIHDLVKCANKHQKLIELCGEMASDPDGCILLIGMGLRHLSMTSSLIPVVKERLSCITIQEAENLTHQALKMGSADEVRKMVTNYFATFESQLPA